MLESERRPTLAATMEEVRRSYPKAEALATVLLPFSTMVLFLDGPDHLAAQAWHGTEGVTLSYYHSSLRPSVLYPQGATPGATHPTPSSSTDEERLRHDYLTRTAQARAERDREADAPLTKFGQVWRWPWIAGH